MNIGNLDIEVSEQGATLRLRHLVRGNPGAVLSWDEVRDLGGRLETALAQQPARTPVAPSAVDPLEGLLG